MNSTSNKSYFITLGYIFTFAIINSQILNKMQRISITLLLFFFVFKSMSQEVIPLPSPPQARWHQNEQIMFIHYGPAVWQSREYDNHTTPFTREIPLRLRLRFITLVNE